MPPTPPRPLSPRKELVAAWLLLLLDAEPTYGYKLRRALADNAFNIEAPVIYRALRKLEDEGRVQSRWLKPAAGPRRRLYRLTPLGRRTLHDIAELIGATRDTHDAFLQAYERTRKTASDRPRDQAKPAAPPSPKAPDSSS